MGEFDNNTEREKAVATGLALAGTASCALWLLIPFAIILIAIIMTAFGE